MLIKRSQQATKQQYININYQTSFITNMFGKMKELASKATNMADKFLNEGAPKTQDQSQEMAFLKQKIVKLEGTIRTMTLKENQLHQQMERIKLESETISTEYFKICEEHEQNQEKVRDLTQKLEQNRITEGVIPTKVQNSQGKYDQIVKAINEEMQGIIERVIQKLNTYVDNQLGQDNLELINSNMFTILSDDQLNRILSRVTPPQNIADNGILLKEREQFQQKLQEKQRIIKNYQQIKHQQITQLLEQNNKMKNQVLELSGLKQQLEQSVRLKQVAEQNMKTLEQQITLTHEEMKNMKNAQFQQKQYFGVLEVEIGRLNKVIDERHAKIIQKQHQTKYLKQENQHLKQELEKMVQQLHMYKNESTDYKYHNEAIIQELKEQTDKSMMSFKQLQDQFTIEVAKSEALQVVNKTLASQCQYLTKKLQNHDNQEIDKQEKQNNEQNAGATYIPESTSKETNLQIEKHKEKYQILYKQHLSLAQAYKSNQHEVADYQYKVSMLYAEQSMLKETLITLQKQFQLVRVDLYSKMQMVQDLEQKICFLETQKQEKEEKHEDAAPRDDQYQQKNSSQEKIGDLQHMIDELMKKNKDLLMEIKQLSTQVYEEKSMSDKLKKQNRQLQAQFEDSEASNYMKDDRMRHLQMQLQQTQKQRLILNGQIQKLNQELQKSRDRIDDDMAIMKQLEMKIQELNNIITQKQKEAIAFSTINSQFIQLKTLYQDIFKEQLSENSLKTLNSKIENLNKTVSEQSQQLDISQSNDKAQLQNLQSKFDQISKYFQQMFELGLSTQTIKSVQQKQQDLAKNIQEKQIIIQNFTNQIKGNQDQLSKIKSQLQQSHQLNKDSQQFRDQLIQQNQLLKHQHQKQSEKSKDNYEQVIKSLKQNILRLEQENKSQQQQNRTKLAQNKKELHAKFTAVWEVEKGKLEDSHQAQVKKLKDTASALEKEYTDMVDLKNKEVIGLSEHIEKSYADKLRTYEEQNKQLLAQITQVKQQLNTKLTIISKLEESISIQKVNYIAEVSKLKQTFQQQRLSLIKQQQGKISSLKEQQKGKTNNLNNVINQQKTKIKQLNDETAQIKDQNKQMVSQLAALNGNMSKFGNLESHLNELNKKLIVKDEEIKRLIVKNQQLSLTIGSLDDALESQQKYTQSKAEQNQQLKLKNEQLKQEIAKSKKQRQSKTVQNTKEYETLLEQYQQLKNKHSKLAADKPIQSHGSQIDANVIKGYFLKYFDLETKHEAKVQIVDTLCEVLKLNSREKEIFMNHKSRLDRMNNENQKKEQEESQSIQNKFFSFLTRQ